MKENPYSDSYAPAQRVACLITGYINKTLTESEHDELDNWVNESDANMKLFEDLTDEKNIKANLEWMEEINSKAAYEKLKKEGKFELPYRRKYSTIWVAASLLMIALGYYFFTGYPPKTNSGTALVKKDSSNKKSTEAGGILLTLEDGTTIDLSKEQNGLIEAGNAVKENDSVLNYGQSGIARVHILKTPPGKIFQLKLPDGSRVWLNASSSLQYPTLFGGSERIVNLEGEGYFEVAKDATKPFKVIMSDSAVVTVLGTAFNVNTYHNEAKEITLVEGLVNVSKDQKNVQLTPGTLVKISADGPGHISKADISAITGWKKGLFVFNDAGIKEIMHQLEHWYNIKTVYRGDIRHQFNATFSRAQSLDEILKLLELNGHVHFKTENNIVYVLP